MIRIQGGQDGDIVVHRLFSPNGRLRLQRGGIVPMTSHRPINAYLYSLPRPEVDEE
ncbi:hypothetical protein ACVWWN_005039 [Mycobacterium sp. URHB0021]